MGTFQKIIIWLTGLTILITLIILPGQRGQPTWKNVAFPLAGEIIVLDPGHGGPDGGAVGKDGTMEKDIVLKIAKMTREYLEQAGAVVYLTREVDKDLAKETKGYANRKSQDIRERLALMDEKQANLFVSIHLNAIPQEKWSGAQTFYTENFPENKLLATNIQEEVIRNLENTDRTPLEIQGIYLLKHAKMPGALVELGFLSNEKERELLQDEKYQKKLATSIYHGVMRYYAEEAEEEQPSAQK